MSGTCPKLGKRLNNKVLGVVTDNWTISGITNALSGAPFTPGFTTSPSIDITGSADTGARIQVIGDARAAGPPGTYFNTAAQRPFTAGDKDYQDFVTARAARNGRAPRGTPAPGAPGAPSGEAQAGRGGSGGGFGNENFGFYLPFNWRGFYDFGSSLIGDWGIHILGPANWALQLGPQHLLSVESVDREALPPFTFPEEIKLKFEFAARGKMPPVTVYWYHHMGGDAFTPPGMTVEQARKIPDQGPQIAGSGRGGFPGGGPGGARGTPGDAGARGARQGGAGGGRGPQGSGYNCVFVGSKGYMGTSGRGEGVGLLPGSKWAEYTLPPQFLTRSPGHQRDWIRACKGGVPACSNFSVACPYTEWLVLGAAAIRTEGQLAYDAKTGTITNNKDANKFLKMDYRKGWEVKL